MRTTYNRRQLLKGASRIGTLAFLPATPFARSARATGDVDPEAIQKLALSIPGRVLAPSNNGYNKARQVNIWNPRTNLRPAVIVQCRSNDDVARTIEFASRNSLAVAARGGGHSFLGWGTCDGGVLIDLSRMSDIKIDPIKRSGKAGGGALTGPFVTAAVRYGLAPVSGECPTVGLAGLTLGGGLGYLSSKYGAACDNVLSARVVTADGRSHTIDLSRTADLFWAIRGGGGNFGVITEFEYRLRPIGEVVAGELVYRFEDAVRVLKLYREFMATVPDDFNAEVTLVTRESVTVTICYWGDAASAERLLRPGRSVAQPQKETIKRSGYGELFQMPANGTRESISFSVAVGLYLPSLPDDLFETVVDHLSRGPQKTVVDFGHYMHGAVCKVPPDQTAFELREPNAVHLFVAASWQNAESSNSYMTWVDQTGDLLRRYSSGRIYANYQSVEGPDSGLKVFDRNYPRLLAAKNKYDPENFFRRNPNVIPKSRATPQPRPHSMRRPAAGRRVSMAARLMRADRRSASVGIRTWSRNHNAPYQHSTCTTRVSLDRHCYNKHIEESSIRSWQRVLRVGTRGLVNRIVKF
jgi:FAD/FMN-containing dehydrogenase